MNRYFKRIASVTLALALCLSVTLGLIPSSAAKYSFAGEDLNTTKAITVDGKETGATYTRIHLGENGSQSVANNRYINIVEADLSNTNLSFEVVNHGEYTTNEEPLTKVVDEYVSDTKGTGKTLLAAVNGDWMHLVNGSRAHNMNVGATKNYYVPTSVVIIDGEIRNSHITSQEVSYDGPYTIGITTSNQPVIGLLKVDTTLKIGGKEVEVNGLNRAPANNAIYIYNERLNSSNYVPADAYELVVKTDGTNKFTHGGTVKGTVTAIYPEGTTERDGLKDGYITITARGKKKISTVTEFKVGDSVEITTTLRDDMEKNNALWPNVKYALGGHNILMEDGIPTEEFDTNDSNYPSNIIGIKDDGTVMMTMVTADTNGKYLGLKFSQMGEFCKSLGYNTCFLFDGGGSTTMITLEADAYVERSCYSDGQIRSTWNSFALVYYDEPVCDKQGSLSHIVKPENFNPLDIDFQLSMKSAIYSEKATDFTVYNGLLTLKSTMNTSSPSVGIDFGTLASTSVNASDYKYIVLKYKADSDVKTKDFKLYPCAGNITDPTESCTASFTMTADGAWHTQVIDLSKVSSWSGNVNKLRMDYLSGQAGKGNTVLLSNLGFAKTADDAEALANDFAARTSDNAPATDVPSTDAPAADATPTPKADDDDNSSCKSVITSAAGLIVIALASLVLVKRD